MELKEIIELILGIVVVVAVITLVSIFFGNQVIDFFKGLSIGNSSGVFLTLVEN